MLAVVLSSVRMLQYLLYYCSDAWEAGITCNSLLSVYYCTFFSNWLQRFQAMSQSMWYYCMYEDYSTQL